MNTQTRLTYERIDSLPVIMEIGKQLGIVEVLDDCLGSHGNQQGLSYGRLALGWLGYILSEDDHRKSAVESWADKRRTALARLLGSPVREGEFNDDRLGRCLERLADPDRWEAIEERLWSRSALVYEWDCESVRLDSTTSYGYHSVGEGGLMQLGHSKDRRPDLPQLKLMAAVAEPAGQLIASKLYPGNVADDVLYEPMIERTRELVGAGKLYIGDAKMAAVSTRAAIVAGGDNYLSRLPKSSSRDEREIWINAAIVQNDDAAQVDADADPWGERYTTQRPVVEAGQEWIETVFVYRPEERYERLSADLDKRLQEAIDALKALSPPPGPGRKQLGTHRQYVEAVDRIEKQFRVQGLLWTVWQVEPWPSPKEPDRTRITIPSVFRREASIEAARDRLGWQVLVTSLPKESLPIEEAIDLYNGGWRIELQYRDLKNRPLGIRPLYVTTETQIRGLTNLLTLALRILTLITTVVRRSLARSKEVLADLYEGQKSRTTAQPTARRLLRAFHRHEVSFVLIRGPGQGTVHVTPLPGSLSRILAHLGLTDDIFYNLAQSPV